MTAQNQPAQMLKKLASMSLVSQHASRLSTTELVSRLKVIQYLT
jgi:hypothetical protein